MIILTFRTGFVSKKKILWKYNLKKSAFSFQKEATNIDMNIQINTLNFVCTTLLFQANHA